MYKYYWATKIQPDRHWSSLLNSVYHLCDLDELLLYKKNIFKKYKKNLALLHRITY